MPYFGVLVVSICFNIGTEYSVMSLHKVLPVFMATFY